jgi:DNA replicative helicase MCM subunit Mcm2 (Cdc46/Mcm family)
LIDEVDKTKDLELAKHIGMVHQGKESQNVGMFET